MKRYLIFAYCQYYPTGGRNDVIGNFETIEEVHTFVTQPEHSHYDDVDILDMEKREWTKMIQSS